MIYKDKKQERKVYCHFSGIFGYCHTEKGTEGDAFEYSLVALYDANSVSKTGYYWNLCNRFVQQY